MKYSIIFLFLLILTSCTNSISNKKVKTFSMGGFAYIYDENDFNNKIINKKFDQDDFLAAHQYLRVGTNIRIYNPINKKSIIIKNSKKVKYPEYYSILITEKVAQKLELDKDVPFIKLDEVKSNKSFVAKKAKTFNEEKRIHSKAPVQKVKISNISKQKNKKKIKLKEFSILIGEFYSSEVVKNLKRNIIDESNSLNPKKLYIHKRKSNKIQLLSGPYNSINSLKNDYIELKKFGFEELEIKINE